MIIGTTKIEKIFDKNNNFIYVSFVDLENPDYEYREYFNETKEWYKNGLPHRDDDKPAIIWPDGSKQWYKNGKIHRGDDEPAVIWSYGSMEWWKNGKCHRDNDEPARILQDGTKEWWKNGRHIRSHIRK